MALGIKCCKGCVPPKRHCGCHATCKEYINEKVQYEEDKQKAKEDMKRIPNLTAYDFEQVNSRAAKRRRR